MPAETFRWEPHTGGLVIVKLKDYEAGELIEAATPYAAWRLLESGGHRLRPGDLLEVLTAAENAPPTLLITKYIGFEPAQWFVPERRSTAVPSPYATGSSELEIQESGA